ncbi:MAG TPA: hypothetical protein VFS43_32445 [Polyangiaceae bacterium]|nr:hypothetical protein [Polyangiaceae bacterium]
MGRLISAPNAPPAALAALAGLALWAGGASPEAVACPVVEPKPSVLTPAREVEASLNERVRVLLPPEGRYGGGPGALRLRARPGPGVEPREIAVRARPLGSAWGYFSLVELTPLAPLAPSTRYEVALVRSDPQQQPPLVVFGAFRTGGSADTTAPRIESVAGVKVQRGDDPACTPDTPQVVLEGLEARDPGRPKAQLLFGVWLADASGNIDPSRPPDDILGLDEPPPPPPPSPDAPNAAPPPKVGPSLVIGRRRGCDDPSALALPAGPSIALGVAAIDEAGNASALRRVKVAVPGAPR